MPAILLIANRLPFTVRETQDGVTVVPSAGGLAVGMRPLHESSDAVWIGWTGVASDSPAAKGLTSAEWQAAGCVPVALTRAEIASFYDEYANGALWPVFHSMTTLMPLQPPSWIQYEAVNRRFAELALKHAGPETAIWVHDYHLMRVPLLVRQAAPAACIGFFLHIPFPALETYSVLPDRRALLEGVLAADVVGFHTATYLENFASAALHLLGAAVDGDVVSWRGHETRLGVFPMGIDAERIEQAASSPEVERLTAEYRADGSRIIVGVDRLDYTKGIPRRLLAFQQLLRRHPELAGSVRLVQVGVPSRTAVPEYRRLVREIEGLAGRINGAFATPTWTPVHYLARSVSEPELLALYRAADVMMVTPIRDGMNLVAKEFVASRSDEDGVLVLSEFAGAAAELGEALQVNPFDLDGTAAALHAALTMGNAERRTRMLGLRHRVRTQTVSRWADSFLATMAETASKPGRLRLRASPPTLLEAAAAAAREAPELLILLDYDGTLVPLAALPHLAAPDAEVRALLEALAARPGTAVHIISGRDRGTLAAWLGDLPIGLHAEHGLWSRPGPDRSWAELPATPSARHPDALRLLEETTSRVPGSLVETKSIGVAWHYRAADPVFAERQARLLQRELDELLRDEPLEVLTGDRVVEIRPRGIHKGVVAGRLLELAPGGAKILAMGDDRTDEDLFAGLPPDAIAIHVGTRATLAGLRVTDVGDARRFLWSIVAFPASAAPRR